MKAFTLIETLVGVTILTLAVSGPLVGASHALVLAQLSRDQLTASYLAQEGIEYVRAMRDDGYLYYYGNDNASQNAWDSFLSGGNLSGGNAWSIALCTAPSVCTVDPSRAMGHQSGEAIMSYSSVDSAPALYLSNTTGGVYTQQQVGTQTPFTRTIQATALSSTDEVITSTVSWSFHDLPYSVTVTDHLTPWQ
jgi:hypothetical protein